MKTKTPHRHHPARKLEFWLLVQAMSNLEFAPWSLEFQTRNLALGPWNFQLGIWNLELGISAEPAEITKTTISHNPLKTNHMPPTTSTRNCRQTKKNKTGRNSKKRITKYTNITSKQRWPSDSEERSSQPQAHAA